MRLITTNLTKEEFELLSIVFKTTLWIWEKSVVWTEEIPVLKKLMEKMNVEKDKY